MNPEQLAEIAYNAYCEHTGWRSLVSGHPLPRWPEVKPEIRAAWAVSARAVAVTVSPSLQFSEVCPECAGAREIPAYDIDGREIGAQPCPACQSSS